MEDWSFFFGWDKKIKDVIKETYGKTYWKEKRKERKPYAKTMITIFKKLKELSEKKSPFAVILEEDKEKSAQTQNLTQEYEKWQKEVLASRRARLAARLLTLAVPGVAAYRILRQPLSQAIITEIPPAAQAAYEEALQYLEDSSDDSLIVKARNLMGLAKTLWQIKQEYGEEVLFEIGNRYFADYAAQISTDRFPQLTVYETNTSSPLSEADFIEPSPHLPKTVGELLSTIEQPEGYQRFLSALRQNFYQRGSFRFSDEILIEIGYHNYDYNFLPQEDVNRRLNELIEAIKLQLRTETNQNLSIDSLNPNSRKHGAISDWDELITEVLTPYANALGDKVALVEPEIIGDPNNPSDYKDWPLEYARRRSAYLATEVIFAQILTKTMLEIQPAIRITNPQQLESFFNESSFLPFNRLEFKNWLDKFSQAFGDEKTKWQFVSWAISYAQSGAIDLDLISRLVDLNRFNHILQESQTSTGIERIDSSLVTLSGVLSLFSQTQRAKLTRREFLKLAGITVTSAALAETASKIGQKVESRFDVIDDILQHFNGQVWQEVERRLPPLLTLNPTGFPEALIVKTAAGQEIGRYFEMNKEFLPFDQIPEEIKKFLVAVEDKRFYDHHGVDPVGIFRALNSSSAGGGSTLTQQLIRLLCFSQQEILQEQDNHNLAYQRKMTEIAAALTLERKWKEYFLRQGYDEKGAHQRTKEKILELYLNNVPFGSNVYGIKAASKFYFNKEPSQLTPIETAFLIGLIQDPVGYNPLSLFYYDSAGERITTGYVENDKIVLQSNHPAVKRLSIILFPLIEQGIVDNETEEWLRNNSFVVTPPPPSEYQYYADMVINHLATYLSRQQLFSGLEVVVPLDLKLQKSLEQKILEKVAAENQNGAKEGAVVVLDGETGAILAAAGARVTVEDSSVVIDNGVTFLDNYPGSSVKPLTYASALAEGRLSESETLTGNRYRGVNNAGQRNYGPQLWRVALASSLNTAAQQVADRLGATYLRNLWDKLRLRRSQTLPLSRISTNITLGTERVRPIDIAAAFTSLINSGKLSRPTPVLQINQHGRPVFAISPEQSIPVFSEEVAQLIFDALSNPENKILPRKQTWAALRDGAGWYFAKTGTESNAQGSQRAVWVVGGMIHPQTQKRYIVLTYLGTQKNRGMAPNVWGASTLAPFWREVLDILKERQ